MGSLCEEVTFHSFISRTFADPSGGALHEAGGPSLGTEGRARSRSGAPGNRFWVWVLG